MPVHNATILERCDRFVVDGAERLVGDVRASIKQEVEADWSERIAQTSWFGRLRLRRKIRNEIDRRVKKRMPSKETLW